MIKLIREDISNILIIVKDPNLYPILAETIKWLPKSMPKTKIFDQVPEVMDNKARCLLIIHHSVVNRRIAGGISEFLKQYQDAGYLVCFIAEKGISASSMYEQEDISITLGISKAVTNMMVDISYSEAIKDFKSLSEYLDRIVPTREEFEDRYHIDKGL